MEQIKHAIRIHPHGPSRGWWVRLVAHGVGELADRGWGHGVNRLVRVYRREAAIVAAGVLATGTGLVVASRVFASDHTLGNIVASLGGVAGLAGVDLGRVVYGGRSVGRRLGCRRCGGVGIRVCALPLVRRVVARSGGRGPGRLGSGGVTLLGRGVAGLGLCDLVLDHVDVNVNVNVVGVCGRGSSSGSGSGTGNVVAIGTGGSGGASLAFGSVQLL